MTNKDPQCTCPHEYKPHGLVRHGTDYACKVHGTKGKPNELHELHLLLAEANGQMIGLVQEMEKLPNTTLNSTRGLIRKICAKIGTPNPLEH